MFQNQTRVSVRGFAAVCSIMDASILRRNVVIFERCRDMSKSSSGRYGAGTAATDSPWFWVMVFSAAGLVVLAVLWPKYVQRQARLELQYRASREVTRRQAAGEVAARLPGQEGDAAPPAAGELLIPLWPLGAVLVVVLGVSTGMVLRGRRAARDGTQPRPPGAVP
jgi:hypothetical protein